MAHEGVARDHDDRPRTEYEILEQAVRELLIEKGVLTAAAIQRQIDMIESRNPALGAKIIAKAWTDAQFKDWLLKDPRAAIASLGIEFPPGPELRVIENTDACHNVVVCTLCSCYPRMVLGIPPAWYKSREYRSRVVVDPRGVLAEFGTQIAEDVEVKVHDSTADLRYLVIPRRPADTERMSEVELEELVTRDSMIGVGQALRPDEAAARSSDRVTG